MTTQNPTVQELTKSLSSSNKQLDNKLDNKRKRIPIDEQRRKLVFSKKDPNFYYRVVNFKNDGTGQGNVQRYLDAGYEIVKDDSGLGDYVGKDSEQKTNTVVSRGVGSGTVGYLMRIPIEFRLEDLDLKRKLADDPLKSLDRKGKKGDKEKGLDFGAGFNAKYNRSAEDSVLDLKREED